VPPCKEIYLEIYRVIKYVNSVSGDSAYCFCTKFGQLILMKIITVVATMSDFKAKMHQNPISAGALPQTPLGELTALPQTP